ncbi:MAG: hypothetical protein ACJ0FM_03985 [Gammaproteobacteria bacterium]
MEKTTLAVSIHPNVWDSLWICIWFLVKDSLLKKNWQSDYDEDTLSVNYGPWLENLEVGDSIWDWEVAYVYDDYYYLNGSEEVMNDTLANVVMW